MVPAASTSSSVSRSREDDPDPDDSELHEITADSGMTNEEILLTKRAKNYEEPPCCKVCLSTRLGIFTVSLVLLIMVVLIMALDLTIFEAERYSRGKYYENYRTNYPETPTEDEPNKLPIVLRGTPSKYLEYNSILVSDRSMDGVRGLDLQYVSISVNQLDNLLNSHFYTLETVTLRNVRLKGQLIPNNRYRYNYMNSIKTLVLELDQPIGPAESLHLDLCDNCLLNNASKYSGDPFSELQELDCFNHLIWFYHSKEEYFHSGSIFDLNMNLTVILYDWVYFKLNYKEGELITMAAQSNEILQSIPNSKHSQFILKKLSLKRCDLGATTLSLFSNTLTHLTLDTVNITGLPEGVPISQLLVGLTKLEHLTLKNSPFTKYYDAQAWSRLGISANMFDLLSKVPRNTVDLAHFPVTLKNLTISDYILAWNSGEASQNNLNFNLDHLTFHRVSFSNYTILTNFQKLFKCRKFAFQPWDHRIRSKHDPTPDVSYFKKYEWLEIVNKVHKSDGVNWIFVDNSFTGNYWHITESGENPILDLFNANGLSHESVTRFILDKKNHPSYWEVQKVDGQNDAQLLWFQLLQMDTFMSQDLALDATW